MQTNPTWLFVRLRAAFSFLRNAFDLLRSTCTNWRRIFYPADQWLFADVAARDEAASPDGKDGDSELEASRGIRHATVALMRRQVVGTVGVLQWVLFNVPRLIPALRPVAARQEQPPNEQTHWQRYGELYSTAGLMLLGWLVSFLCVLSTASTFVLVAPFLALVPSLFGLAVVYRRSALLVYWKHLGTSETGNELWYEQTLLNNVHGQIDDTESPTLDQPDEAREELKKVPLCEQALYASATVHILLLPTVLFVLNRGWGLFPEGSNHGLAWWLPLSVEYILNEIPGIGAFDVKGISSIPRPTGWFDRLAMVGHALVADIMIIRILADQFFGIPDPLRHDADKLARRTWLRDIPYSQELANSLDEKAVEAFREVARSKGITVRQWFEQTRRTWNQLTLDVPLKALAAEAAEDGSGPIEYLMLRACTVDKLVLGEVLGNLGGVRHINLSNSSLHDRIWDDLNGVHQLQVLKLNFSDVDNALIECGVDGGNSPKLGSLQHLHLRRARFSTDKVKILGRLEELKTLELRQVDAVTDEALEAICRRLKQLQVLDVGDTEVTAGGIVQLKNLLTTDDPPLRQLRDLYLDGTKIDTHVLESLHEFVRDSELRRIHLGKSDIPDEVVIQFERKIRDEFPERGIRVLHS